MLHIDNQVASEASRQDALRYLFAMKNEDKFTPLELAASFASAPVIFKIINNPPYIFMPEQKQLANENGAIGKE